MKTYIVGTHKKCLNKALLISTNKKIIFRTDIKNIDSFWLKKKKCLIWSYAIQNISALDHN